MTVEMKKGDLFFTAGASLLARLIRWGERWEGNPDIVVNHMGGYVENGPLGQAHAVEALWRTVKTKRVPKSNEGFVVFRPKTIPKAALHGICKRVSDRVGSRYGWWKLLLIMVDTKILKRRLLSRAQFVKDRHYCSFLWAEAYSHYGFNFGVPYKSATPDDMFDYCASRPDKYELIMVEGEF